jgi:hypothetical protein
MASIPKIIGIIACSVVLGLSVFSATQATGSMRHDPCADRKGGLPNLVMCDENMRQGIETGKGEVHSSATQATGTMRHDPCADRKGGLPNLVMCDEETRQGIETIKGEVLSVEGSNYVVERFDGKEVWLHLDQTTKMSGHIGRGDQIEAKVREVNDQEQVLSIHQTE